jgi:hypothetical protein
MIMTPEQLATLKAGILAETNDTFATYRSNGQNGLMANWLNKPKTPSVKAWRDDVQPQELDEETPWTSFDTLSDGKRDSWLQIFKYPRNFNKSWIRKWLTDVWGAATASSVAEAIFLGVCVKNISRVEAILGGSTTATTNNVTALQLAWTGPVSDVDIGNALQLP